MTVWVAPSRFVKLTRAPAWTLRLDGVKAKLMIVTDAAIIGGAVGADVGRGIETAGWGVGAGVSRGVGDAVGDGVAPVTEGD